MKVLVTANNHKNYNQVVEIAEKKDNGWLVTAKDGTTGFVLDSQIKPIKVQDN